MSLKKATNYLLLLLLFLLPWQTRYIYGWGQINGGHWEYGTFSLYVTEILLWLIILLFSLDRFAKKKFWQKIISQKHFRKNWLGLLIALLFLSFNALVIFTSLSPKISYQHNLWVLGGVCLGLVIISKNNLKIKMWLALWLGAVVQALLAIWQFFSQQVYACKWLGLASQDPSDAGVSVIQFADERWMRAYGGFGWPNSLGVYLATLLVLGLILSIKYCKTKRACLVLTIGQLIILFGLILSFSRGAWLAALIGVVLLFIIIFKQHRQGLVNKILLEKLSKQLLVYLVFILVWIILLAPLFVARFDLNNNVERVSIAEHKYQYVESMNIIYRNPWLGIGPGTYTLYLYKQNPRLFPWQYQPAHNIYVLWLVETGFVGLIVYLTIILYLGKQVWQHNLIFIPVLTVILIHGIFDHWLWTLYGGIIFWWVIWAISLRFCPKGT